MASDTKSATTETSNPSNLSGHALHWLLANVQAGSITVTDPAGYSTTHRGREPGPDADIAFVSWRTLRRLLRSGHVGFAEAFMAGDFTTTDLTALLTWAMANEASIAKAWDGTWVARIVGTLQHVSRRNSLAGSRRNISAHYDLGNRFYAAWLDDGMSYSSALYSGHGQTLEGAQRAKNDRIVELMELRSGLSVLEIGCGWGGLAERLAVDEGCAVTGLTLSAEQLAFAQHRLAAVSPPPDLRLQDYRKTTGAYDRIASIEMIEAVGERYWPAYFQTLRRCLKPGGIAVVQAITIEERYFAAYRAHPDFIQKHIFPGGMLPTQTIMREQTEAAGLTLQHAEHFGLSYALTLAEWRRRFHASWPKLKAMGFDETFRRKWEYYLSYCETGFRLGTLDVGLYQIVA